jgi:hypothetical protein
VTSAFRYLPDATLASLGTPPMEVVEAVEAALVSKADGRLDQLAYDETQCLKWSPARSLKSTVRARCGGRKAL